MACACKGRASNTYVWTGTDKDGNKVTATYTSLVEAKAKVLRKGGSYETIPTGG